MRGFATRRVAINDISKPVYSFWKLVLDDVDWLCKRIRNIELSVTEWDRQKAIYKNPRSSLKKLGFAFFYLNRTNRSGILNAGIIGGRSQESQWKIDARFNRDDLILRIRRISAYKNKITLTCLDAADFIEREKVNWQKKTLIYLDPPYYEKGRLLYHDCYKSSDHEKIAKKVMALETINWIVSYDDVLPIHSLYEDAGWLQYSLSYSAYKKVRGREAMFFSDMLKIPDTLSQMQEIDRGTGACNGGTQPKNRISSPSI